MCCYETYKSLCLRISTKVCAATKHIKLYVTERLSFSFYTHFFYSYICILICYAVIFFVLIFLYLSFLYWYYFYTHFLYPLPIISISLIMNCEHMWPMGWEFALSLKNRSRCSLKKSDRGRIAFTSFAMFRSFERE